MGNYITYRPSEATGRVILSDGTVHEFDKPLTVAELMLEHPQQVVMELGAAVSEKRPTPLPADKKLEIKKVYVMLPMRRGGKPASLSSAEASHVLKSANALLRSKSSLSFTSPKFLPLLAKICRAVAAGEGRVVKYVHSQEEKAAAEVKFEFFPESFEEGRPEFLSRQVSGKGWKPSLDTIKEKKVKKKLVNHWSFQKGLIVSN